MTGGWRADSPTRAEVTPVPDHQPGLFDRPAPEVPAETDPPWWFDGATFDYALDGHRLSGQLQKVWGRMIDGRWRTLAELSAALEYPEASLSARLRDLRKERFGSHTVHRRRRMGHVGLWEYRLEPR